MAPTRPTPGEVALALAEAGFSVLPDWWPLPGGDCAFGFLHDKLA